MEAREHPPTAGVGISGPLPGGYPPDAAAIGPLRTMALPGDANVGINTGLRVFILAVIIRRRAAFSSASLRTSSIREDARHRRLHEDGDSDALDSKGDGVLNIALERLSRGDCAIMGLD